MHLARFVRAVMGVAARRPLAVGLAVGLVALAGAALALLRLEPSAATDTLVGRSTASFEATERLHRRFGDDAVYVLVREPVTKLTLTADIQRVLGLEGCISGNAPSGAKLPGGPSGACSYFARVKPAKVVFGPGTFINEAVGRIADEFGAQAQAKSQQAKRAGAAARKLARAKGWSPERVRKAGQDAEALVFSEFTRDLLTLAARYGMSPTSLPQLNNPEFVSRIVFDTSKGVPAGTPKARFAYLFPNRSSALVQVRLRAGLSEHERKQAISRIRQAVAMPEWRLADGTYVVTGAPVIVADLTGVIGDAIFVLLIAALVIMALTLAIVFRARMRLLPLVVALAATGMTFGGLALVGAPLTMASIGVLPVLIGLAVDYAIQLQARIQEREASTVATEAAVDAVGVAGAPTVATAAAATAAGFLVLALSPVPMVQAFGLLLVAGIFLAFFCALSLGTAALVAGAPGGALGGRMPAVAKSAGRSIADAWRGAGELLIENRPARALGRRTSQAGRSALEAARRRPGRVIAVGLVAAVAGWGLDSQTAVESDVLKLVPQDLPALRDLQALQRSTGVGGEIDVVVTSSRLTDPDVVAWMARYQKQLLDRFGYSKSRECGRATLCPAFSLPDLVSGTARTDAKELAALLDAVPPYFSQGVITPDRRTATLAFGIRFMPLARQQEVIETMRSQLHPPLGVRAELAGLPVLASEANDRVSSPWRRALTLLAGLLAVGVVLLLAFRRWDRAVIPLVPIALATGWSALVLFVLRIPLNPMSVTLGALVIAISTEFSVLLAERYRQERAVGRDPADALAVTYRSTGAAVLASGTTAIVGFAVLALSDIRMLRDFGIATVIDLSVSLLGVLVVLPSVLMLAERGGLRRLPRALARRAGAGRLRPGKAPTG